MQISRIFHAEWVAKFQRNLSGIVAESFRNFSASLAESICALSRLDFMQLKHLMHILRRMGRGISAESQRNLNGIVAESFRNCSGIVLESFRNPSASIAECIEALSRLDSMQPEDSATIPLRFC